MSGETAETSRNEDTHDLTQKRDHPQMTTLTIRADEDTHDPDRDSGAQVMDVPICIGIRVHK